MDIFATKGIEYLLVIGYLLVFIPFWRFLRRSVPDRAAVTAAPRRAPRLGGVGAWGRVGALAASLATYHHAAILLLYLPPAYTECNRPASPTLRIF